jgi:hypothetical protein
MAGTSAREDFEVDGFVMLPSYLSTEDLVPRHGYWTDGTLAGCALRYPGLDVDAWRGCL